MSGFPILSVITFVPLVGAVLLLFLDKRNFGLLRGWTLAVSAVTFALSLPLWFGFDASKPGMQFVEQARWIESLGIQYYLGVDGISVFLVLLTTFLTVICVLAS